MFEKLPVELVKKISEYLDIRNLKKMSKLNKNIYSILKMKIQILASNMIKYFLKNLKKPKNYDDFIEAEEEEKLTVKDWMKIYYFYYPKRLLKSQLNLITRKIGYFYGSKRTEDMKNICEKYSNLSTRYIIIRCITEMSKEEIETIGW